MEVEGPEDVLEEDQEEGLEEGQDPVVEGMGRVGKPPRKCLPAAQSRPGL